MKSKIRFKAVLRDSSSFYQFLCAMSRVVRPGMSIGSCTDCRFTFSQGNVNTDWSEHTRKLLDLCKGFYSEKKTITRQASMQNMVTEVVNRMVNGKHRGKSEFCGVGAMGANQFIQLSSLIGLIPMYCYSCAEILDLKLGPAMLMKKALDRPRMTLTECNKEFHGIVSQLRKIWNDNFTPFMVENILCELSRAFNQTSKEMKRVASRSQEFSPQQVIDEMVRESDVARESDAVDIFYHDDIRDSVMGMFAVKTNGGSATTLRPLLVMRDGTKWNVKGRAKFWNLTNWLQNIHDPKMFWWSKRGNKMSLDSHLEISQQAIDLFQT